MSSIKSGSALVSPERHKISCEEAVPQPPQQGFCPEYTSMLHCDAALAVGAAASLIVLCQLMTRGASRWNLIRHFTNVQAVFSIFLRHGETAQILKLILLRENFVPFG